MENSQVKLKHRWKAQLVFGIDCFYPWICLWYLYDYSPFVAPTEWNYAWGSLLTFIGFSWTLASAFAILMSWYSHQTRTLNFLQFFWLPLSIVGVVLQLLDYFSHQTWILLFFVALLRFVFNLIVYVFMNELRELNQYHVLSNV